MIQIKLRLASKAGRERGALAVAGNVRRFRFPLPHAARPTVGGTCSGRCGRPLHLEVLACGTGHLREARRGLVAGRRLVLTIGTRDALVCLRVHPVARTARRDRRGGGGGRGGGGRGSGSCRGRHCNRGRGRGRGLCDRGRRGNRGRGRCDRCRGWLACGGLFLLELAVRVVLVVDPFVVAEKEAPLVAHRAFVSRHVVALPLPITAYLAAVAPGVVVLTKGTRDTRSMHLTPYKT